MSKQAISLLTLSVAASGALTANRFVGHDGAVAAAAGNALGVNRTDAADTEVTPVDVIGTAVVEAVEAIAVGGAIEVGANGKAAAKAAGITVARALQEATADGDFIEVLLLPN